MAKALKIAAVVVAVAAIVLTAGTAIFGATATAAFFGISTTALAAITAGLSVTASVLGMAANALAKKPKLGSAGTQLDFTADPAAGEPYIIGRARVGVDLVHEATWGTKNKFLGMVGILSICTIQAFNGFYTDGNLTTFTGTNATGYYNGFMHLTTQLGAMPEAAALDMTMGGATTGMPDWGSAYKLSGCGALGLVLTADIDNGKIYSGGAPKMNCDVSGVKTYSALRDSTNGGSGTERPLNESTYTFSDNPWDHHGTYAIGRFQGSSPAIRVIGPGVPVAQVDWASHRNAANVATANNWKASGRVMSTDSKWEVLKAIAQAGGGYPIPSGSKLYALVNTPRVSLDTIQEADVRGRVTAPQMAIRRNRLNGAIPRYRSANHGWEIIPGNTVRNSTYLTEDGGNEKTREVEFALVADTGNGVGATQAAQLAAYYVANSREKQGISVEVGLVWSQYHVGDCLTVNLPKQNLVSQKCVITGRTLNVGKGTITLTLMTETDAKHTWALGLTGSTTTAPTVILTPGAGDTGSGATGVDDPIQSLFFKYDYLSTPLSGEFPRDLTFKLNGAQGQITSGITWQWAVNTGTVNGTITQASGLQSMSGTGTGTLTISSLDSTKASITVLANLNGFLYLKTVQLTRQVADPPTSGGGGGGPTTIFNYTGPFTNISNTTFVDITGARTGTIPTGQTTADITAAIDFEPAHSGTYSATVELKLMRDIAGTPTLIGAVQSAVSDWNASDVSGDPAHFAYTFHDTGLTAGTTYTYRVYARVSAGGTHTHSPTGAFYGTSG